MKRSVVSYSVCSEGDWYRVYGLQVVLDFGPCAPGPAVEACGLIMSFGFKGLDLGV